MAEESNRATMARRRFIVSTIGGMTAGWAAATLLKGPCAHYIVRVEKGPNDFVVLEKTDDASSLEDIIYKGERGVSKPFFNRISMDSRLTPSLIYTLGVARFNLGWEECTGTFTNLSQGSCSIINDRGYALTAFHVISNYIEKPSNAIILYDPRTEIIRKPKVLSYSKKLDLALLKIDVPEDFKAARHYLTIGHPNPGGVVCWTEFDPAKTSDMDNVVMKVVNSTDFVSSGLGCDLWHYRIMQKAEPELNLGNLGFNIEYSHIIGVLGAEDKKPVSFDNTFFITGEIKNGHSGLPVFSKYGNLAGIITGSFYPSEENGFYCECEGNPKIVRCIAPEKIRSFLHSYIEACRNRGRDNNDTRQ